jgi:predicted amidophosphoribosyltransferase
VTTNAAQSVQPISLKCPVCNAGFRGDESCPRCGTSLRQLMRLTAHAWALREISRTRLRAGDLSKALQYAAKASQIQQK